MNDQANLPKWNELMQPVLDALQTLGGSCSPNEVAGQIIKDLSLTGEQVDGLTTNGTSRFVNRVQWARFYLSRVGYIDGATRGLWVITEKGRQAELSKDDIKGITRQVEKDIQVAKDLEPDAENDEEAVPTVDYIQDVLEVVKNLTPQAFERLCRRILRESGFQSVTITGGSGDGGIDGFGVLQINPLLSFQVFFQCKRYKEVVSPSVVRDFRGAMAGRADKGIILTTGRFTKLAKEEAIRDGVPPIELVDGEQLVELLAKFGLGLTPVTTYELQSGFFEQFSGE